MLRRSLILLILATSCFVIKAEGELDLFTFNVRTADPCLEIYGYPTSQQLEADVYPTNTPDYLGGDGILRFGDWDTLIDLSRGVRVPVNDCEFVLADCAPLESKGDGRIDVADVYVAFQKVIGRPEPWASGGGPLPGVSSPVPEIPQALVQLVETPKKDLYAVQQVADVKIAAMSFRVGWNTNRLKLVSTFASTVRHGSNYVDVILIAYPLNASYVSAHRTAFLQFEPLDTNQPPAKPFLTGGPLMPQAAWKGGITLMSKYAPEISTQLLPLATIFDIKPSYNPGYSSVYFEAQAFYTNQVTVEISTNLIHWTPVSNPFQVDTRLSETNQLFIRYSREMP